MVTNMFIAGVIGIVNRTIGEIRQVTARSRDSRGGHIAEAGWHERLDGARSIRRERGHWLRANH